MTCPKCGSENCSVITDSTTYSHGYDVCSGLIGALFMGPMGMLCGLCGIGQDTVKVRHRWNTKYSCSEIEK